jgi:hypothetical protein
MRCTVNFSVFLPVSNEYGSWTLEKLNQWRWSKLWVFQGELTGFLEFLVISRELWKSILLEIILKRFLTFLKIKIAQSKTEIYKNIYKTFHLVRGAFWGSTVNLSADMVAEDWPDGDGVAVDLCLQVDRWQVLHCSQLLLVKIWKIKWDEI